MNYYWVTGIEDLLSTVAYAPLNRQSEYELINYLKDRETLPFDLVLHDVYISHKLIKGGLSNTFHDYQPNNLAWPLMSERMKSIIINNLTGKEPLKWISAVVQGVCESRKYYIPMFTKRLNILNRERSVIIPSSGIVAKPCFNGDIIKDYAIIHGPNMFWQISSSIYINENIKRDLIKNGIRELEYNRVGVV